MRASGPAAGTGQKSWLSLWRERADNPLLKYWSIADRHRSNSRTYRVTTAVALICGALLALICTGLIIAFNVNALHSVLGVSGRLFRLASLSASFNLLRILFFFLAFPWFGERYFYCIATGLEFLQTTGKSDVNQLYDDLLVVSPMGKREVVFGMLFRSWRLLALPAACLAAVTALLTLPVGGYDMITDPLYRSDGFVLNAPLLSIAARFCLVLAGTWLFALVSAGFHVLISLLLGLGNKGGLMPMVGTFLYLQTLLALMNLIPITMLGARSAGADSMAALYSLINLAAVSSFLFCAFLLIAAVYNASLRRALAYAFPAIVVASVGCSIVLGSTSTNLLTSFKDFVDMVQTAGQWFAVYSPASTVFLNWQELLLLLASKFVFLVLTYFLALRAVELRRAGEQAV